MTLVIVLVVVVMLFGVGEILWETWKGRKR